MPQAMVNSHADMTALGAALLRGVALVCAALTMLMLGVVISARVGMLPKAPDLPQRFLPGNPLPKETACSRLSDEHIPRCLVHRADAEVYFSFDAETRLITGTIMPAPRYTVGDLITAWGTPSGVRYTVGDLITAWGTPSGVTLNETNTFLYWGTRSALLYAWPLQPNSPVDFILYDLEPRQASPWRGFTSVKH